uniref:Uncharacterized protein LOC100175087 n=1 Tax=Phallusia mammillata TaxID=59560 RepID=A0A6F9DH22_9ASCI|nr:uncharacterized protein LOC100175087 [Phallusia mammillata]
MSQSHALHAGAKLISLVDTVPRIQSSILEKGSSVLSQLMFKPPVKKVAKNTVQHQHSVVCRPCTADDRNAMVDFMTRQFVTREPLMQSVHATTSNSRMFVEHCIDEALIQEASFIARNEDTGKVFGVRLNAIGPSSGIEMENDFGFYINLIPRFLHHMEKDVPKLLGTDSFMRHVAICVEPGAIQCGVATDLMKASAKHAKVNGLKNMVAMCSWKLPYKLAQKVGFRSVLRVPYAEYAESLRCEGEKAMEPFLSLAKSEGVAHTMVRDV